MPLGYQGSYQRVRARADVWSYADTRTAAGPHRAKHPSRNPHPDGTRRTTPQANRRPHEGLLPPLMPRQVLTPNQM